MSGIATEAQVQTQWDEIVTLMERMRRWGDDTNGVIDLLENLEQSAIGSYTPQGLASFAATTRASFSALSSGNRALLAMTSMLYEYGKVVESPYTDLNFVFRDVYDYLHGVPTIVPSRKIVFGTPVAVGTPKGDGVIHRLTKDWNGYDTEACRTETKRFICRSDRYSGSREHAETFEFHGQQASIDALALLDFGTGPLGTTLSRHAGSGEGGSLLRDSSFSAFDGTTFNGWVATGTIEQDLVNWFRSYPGATVDASAKMNAGSTLTQLIETQARSLDPNSPYFLRVMVNIAAYGATGAFTISIGNSSYTVPDVTLLPFDGRGWAEVMIPADKDAWFRNFNAQGLSVVLDASAIVGDILVDDCILTAWDEIDGTFWLITGGFAPWLLDDEYNASDTLTNPGGIDGIRNYWTYLAGLGYLPHDNGTGVGITWNDPTIPTVT